MRECSTPTTFYMSGVTCHMSGVTCHVSHVTFHLSHVRFLLFIFFGRSGEAYLWRVCYQRGLPRLVLRETATVLTLHNRSKSVLVLAHSCVPLRRANLGFGGNLEISSEMRLKLLCYSLFYPAGQVVFIHLDQDDKTCSSTIILASSQSHKVTNWCQTYVRISRMCL